MHTDPHRASWLGSDRLVPRRLGQPILRFLQVEAAGGVLLVAAALCALVWANSPWQGSYQAFWHTELGLGVGRHALTMDLHHWVNDGLMAVFFFVLGVEIKHELVAGELRDRRTAVLPVVGAIGGMVVPAALYLAVTGGGDLGRGWGVPMATDVAFALGVLALVGDRAPHELKVLLLALAIVDDIGAVLVIAAFYSESLSLGWLAGALAALAGVAVARRAGIRYLPVYLALGALCWWMTYESGVHATIAGVALGLVVPARPLLGADEADAVADELSSDVDVTAVEVRSMAFRLRESVSVAERLQAALHPWTSYVVVPLFVLANSGIVLSTEVLSDAAGSRLTAAVVVALVAGKALGVVGAIQLARRSGLVALPAGLTGRHLAGLGCVAGVGFTVSIFIANLAFADPALVDQARIGVLVASVVAGAITVVVLPRRTPDRPSG